MNLLEVRELRVDLGGRTVLREVSFGIRAGESLGLVGESGSGKTTLARAILRLVPAAGGEVLWRGTDLLRCSPQALRRHRRGLQMVFQDPVASLDPRMSVADIVAEPLRVFEPGLPDPARRARSLRMLERVGLGAWTLGRGPRELSGGQCQRVAIARAMILEPRLLVCDEPVSALDVSMQGQIVNLLIDLQRELGTAMLFISHNLAVVRHICHRVMVLHDGAVVETADCESLFRAPADPYTRALLAAVPPSPRRPAGAARDIAP